MSNDPQTQNSHPAVGGDREPAPADRPPVSRVGDELQRIAESTPEAGNDVDAEQADHEAIEAARRRGWDKDLRDT